MTGKEDYFLSFNKDEIFKGIVAVEGHFRNIKPGFEPGDLACIVKHLADIEGHCDEAISHSLMVEGKETSSKFQQLRDKVRELRRKVQKNEITPEQGIKEIRQIRSFFERFNPSYDVSKCKACGNVEETIQKLKETLQKIRQPTFKELEENMAQKVINMLSKKYGVPPPKLEITDECHEPDVGVYMDGTIKLCRGGVNLHVILHEFGHYLQQKYGKPIDEEEAERFAVEMMQKNLYSVHANYEGSGENHMTLRVKDIALVYGGQHIGKGIVRGLEYLDTLYPGAIFGADPSLIADLFGTVGGIIGGLYLKEPFDVLSTLIGGYMSTDLWRQAEKMAAPAVTVRFVPVTPTSTVSQRTVKVPASTTQPAITSQKGRYRITG